MRGGNLDPETVRDFGREWAAFDQRSLDDSERRRAFDNYFGLMQLEGLAEGFDFGCGSGRWAAMVVAHVGLLHCIDASSEALSVARANLAGIANVRFHQSDADGMPLDEGSQDFGYSLGVLHHIPDPEAAMRACVARLKPGAPFLVYLYYSFDNRPAWFKTLWQISDLMRRLICRMPFPVKRRVTDLIAAAIYFPLSQASAALERLGFDVMDFPLSFYRHHSFYTMRTDALDRFGTRLEKRFSREEIAGMMSRCGLNDIRFSDSAPYWVACGRVTAEDA